MRRMRATEAKRVMREELGARKCDLSYDPGVADGPREEAAESTWWEWAPSKSELTDTNYVKARIAAYQRIAGSEPLYAKGLRLDRGRVWMDRSVIARMLKDGLVEFHDGDRGNEPYFVVTPAGEGYAK